MSDSRTGVQTVAAGAPHLIVELADRLDPGIKLLSNATDFAIKPISVGRAFRDYNWLAGTPVLNSTGNLRGMVISRTARSVWSVSANVGEKLALAGIIIEFAKSLSRMQQVWDANMSVNEKGPRLLLLGSAAILRGVTSVVPEAVHLAALSAEGYLDIAGAVTGSSKPAALVSDLQRADAWVTGTHRAQWDGDNWYAFISQHAML